MRQAGKPELRGSRVGLGGEVLDAGRALACWVGRIPGNYGVRLFHGACVDRKKRISR